jgi:uncharacterized lipoprotein YajG
MRQALRLVVVLGAMWLLTGCAFTTSKLDVAYSTDSAQGGPLAALPPRVVNVAAFTDKRPDTARIGYKRNGFGAKTADIVSARPVPEIVRDAIAAELAKSGHGAAGAARPEEVVSGEVTDFWFDLAIGFVSIEYTGTVGAIVNVTDAAGTSLLSRRYQGVQIESRLAGYEGAWTEVMNTALAKLVREMSTDFQLAEALTKK